MFLSLTSHAELLFRTCTRHPASPADLLRRALDGPTDRRGAAHAASVNAHTRMTRTEIRNKKSIKCIGGTYKKAFKNLQNKQLDDGARVSLTKPQWSSWGMEKGGKNILQRELS